VERTLMVWCPDWPVTAAGFGPRDVVAVITAGQVVACSKAARERGVAIGMRRRLAESRGGELVAVRRDSIAEARLFDPVVAAVAELAPEVEVIRPGLCALAARGPARYFGGEHALCQRLVGAVQRAQSAVAADAIEVQAGVADGPFAAALAARAGVVVPVGASAAFLAEFPVAVLGRPELADLLMRLGITTLGSFAALDPVAILARFGPDGAMAHRMAGGLDERPLRLTPPTEELMAVVELDPPADRVDIASFAARGLAADLAEQLGTRGLVCVLLTIEAETAHGERLSRRWRAETEFAPEAMTQRLRWQLEGWLAGTVPEASPTAGLSRLRFVATEVVPSAGEQLGLWGRVSDHDRRAIQGLDRLRGMLGPTGVFTGALLGGRSPLDRETLVAWGEDRPCVQESQPWPGRHPIPAPTLVHREPLRARVHDGRGDPVVVSGRGLLTSVPQVLQIGDGTPRALIAWGGPWLFDERWWDPDVSRRRARFQLVREDGTAYLCFVERNQWWIEATYD
jgi:protein ImuB